MGKVIGIDLGTTNSVAAYVEGKNPEVVLTPEGERLLPSLVAFSKAGERLVGNPAKSQLITNPNTIYSVKRLVGKRYSEVAPYLEQFSYPIVEGEDDTRVLSVNLIGATDCITSRARRQRDRGHRSKPSRQAAVYARLT